MKYSEMEVGSFGRRECMHPYKGGNSSNLGVVSCKGPAWTSPGQLACEVGRNHYLRWQADKKSPCMKPIGGPRKAALQYRHCDNPCLEQ